MFSFSPLSWFLKLHSQEVQSDGEWVLHSVHNISSLLLLPPHTFPLHQVVHSMASWLSQKICPTTASSTICEGICPWSTPSTASLFWLCCIQGCFFSPYSLDCSAAFCFFFFFFNRLSLRHHHLGYCAQPCPVVQLLVLAQDSHSSLQEDCHPGMKKGFRMMWRQKQCTFSNVCAVWI